MRDWVGELAPLDQAGTDLLVRRTAGEVPASVRLVLNLLADGVRLTPGGRLPRAVVRQVQQQRPQWDPLGRPAGLEDDLPPLAALHDLMRDVGLLRLASGVLRPTRAAANEREVVRRLRTWFSSDEFTSLLASDVAAMLSATGPLTGEELAGRLHPFYDRWSRNGRPLTQQDVQMSISGARRRPAGAGSGAGRLADVEGWPVGAHVAQPGNRADAGLDDRPAQDSRQIHVAAI